MEALVSLGCMARAPAAHGSPASLSADNMRCTDNGDKGHKTRVLGDTAAGTKLSEC